MKIRERDDTRLVIEMEERFDHNRAVDLEKELFPLLTEIQILELDLEKTSFISSAGLRILLKLQKAMTAQHGTMKLTHPVDKVAEVFQMTGFTRVMTIES